MKEVEAYASTKIVGIKKTLLKLSQAFDCQISMDKDNVAKLPITIGEGFLQFHEIESGFAFYKQKLKFYEPVKFVNRPGIQRSYFIRFLENETLLSRLAEYDLEFKFMNKNSISAACASSHYKTTFCYPKDTSVTAVWLIFDKEWIIKNCFRSGDNDNALKILLNDDPIQRVLELDINALKIVKELLIEQFSVGNIIVLKGILLTLFSIYLKKAYSESNTEKRVSFKDAITIIDFLKDLKKDLNKQWPKINEAALSCGMSQSKFIRIFNSIYDKNYYEYYRGLRMEKAAELLNKGCSIYETSIDLGFQNISHFASEFKKHFLIEPHNYNKEHQWL